MRAAVAVGLVIVLLAGGVGGAVGQSAPNATNGTNGSSLANGTTVGPINTTTIGNATNPTGVTNGTNATNATNQSAAGGGNGGSTGGFGFGVPSTDEVAGDLVNATVGAAANAFTDAAGGVFMFPWKFVTMRFAPFEDANAAASGPLAVWDRPDAPLFGTIYDIAMNSMMYIGLLFFAAFFIIDWFGNLSQHPGADGPVERLFLRAADCLHLLFSWPIAWGHFLLASYLAFVFMPSQEAIAGTVNEGLTNVIGLMGASAALIFVPFLLVIFLWLLLKHAGAFIYLVIGLAAYPVLVAAGIPDHPILGRLGAFAENTRSKYVVAAWWPVPTAAVLGIGYQVDGALLDLMTAGNLLNDAPAGAIVYPILWLAALYAPIKVFADGSPPMRNWRKSFSRGGGGSAGGGSGPSPSSGSAALMGGAAGALAAGSGAAAGSTASSGGSLATSGSSGAFSRLNAGTSASARTLSSDGGLQTMNASSSASGPGTGPGGPSALGGGTGPSPGAGSTAGSSGATSGTSGAYSTSSTSSGWNDVSLNQSENIAQPTAQTFDSGQRYEPYTYHEKNGFQRLDPPKRADWLASEGGIDRLNEATDEPLRFKGENDGRMYDLSNVNQSGSSLNTPQNSGAETIRDS